MSPLLLAGMLGLGLAACSSAVAREPDRRDAELWPFGNHAVDRTLVAGTLIEATIRGPLSWRHIQPGESLMAVVSADVRNARHWVVIPAGCPVGVSVALSTPAARRATEAPLLDVTSVTVWGRVYPVRATVASRPVPSGTQILFVLHEGFTVERRVPEGVQGHATGQPTSK
jgi:hypothetical protein